MNISFSTISQSDAEEFLKHKNFSFLNDKQKKYIKENLGDIRVQDPMMYASPKIEIHENQQKHHKWILAAKANASVDIEPVPTK